MRVSIIVLGVLWLLAGGCRRGADSAPGPGTAPGDDAGGGRLVVLAAASTVDVITELADQFERETGVAVELSFAASSVLARQIEAGAPADIYLSADRAWMDYLRERKLVREATCFDLLENRLVVVVPAARDGTRPTVDEHDGARDDAHVAAHGELSARDARVNARGGEPVALDEAFDFAALCAGGLALGDPAHVPAGRYVRQALEHAGWWSRVEERVIPAADVREALKYVALGEVDAGIVYATDAAASLEVRVVARVPRDWHDPIRYPVAACAESGEAADRFLAFLRRPSSVEIYRRRGFVAP